MDEESIRRGLSEKGLDQSTIDRVVSVVGGKLESASQETADAALDNIAKFMQACRPSFLDVSEMAEAANFKDSLDVVTEARALSANATTHFLQASSADELAGMDPKKEARQLAANYGQAVSGLIEGGVSAKEALDASGKLNLAAPGQSGETVSPAVEGIVQPLVEAHKNGASVIAEAAKAPALMKALTEAQPKAVVEMPGESASNNQGRKV